MNILAAERRAQVISALVEGNSIGSVSRMTGVARNTVMSLLVQIGTTCAIYQGSALSGYDSIWTGTALDADTKLICSRMVGNRDAFAAREFVQDLVGPLAIVRNASEIVVQAKIRECLTRANPLILLAE